LSCGDLNLTLAATPAASTKALALTGWGFLLCAILPAIEVRRAAEVILLVHTSA